MSKIKEILRLHYEKGLSTREIAKSLSIGRSTVNDYLYRSQRAGLNWFLAADLDETSLKDQLYPPVPCVTQEKRQLPSMEYLYHELKKKSTPHLEQGYRSCLGLLRLEKRYSTKCLDPVFHLEHSGFDPGFVLGSCHSGRDNDCSVMLCEVPIGGIECRFVTAGPCYSRLHIEWISF